MNFFRRYSFIILIVITIIVGFNFFIQDNFIKTKLYKIEGAIAAITKPIQWGFQKSSSGISTMYQNYFEFVDIKQKYLQLQKENTVLQTQLHMTEGILKENQKLKTILTFKENNPFDFMIGKIIGYDPSFTFKSIKINLGRENGIQPGMGALSPVGVVGVIVRVQAKTSDVLLMTDPNSNLDTIIARNQSRGILQGKLASTMRFKYFDHTMNVWVGDKIVTSGLTGAFPANIPVGTVVKVKKNQDELSQVIEVEPAVNFVKLTEVLILKTSDPAVDSMREIGGADWIEHVMNVGAGRKDESE